jgi:hypothetical protein
MGIGHVHLVLFIMSFFIVKWPDISKAAENDDPVPILPGRIHENFGDWGCQDVA